MNTQSKFILERLLPFGLAGILFGLLYNAAYYSHTLIEFTESGIVGLLLGLATGMVEEYLLRDWLRQRSFFSALLVRTFLYALIAAVSLGFVLSLEPFIFGKCAYCR